MNVVTTPEAAAFIRANGGVAYVRPLTRKCCGGAMTTLSATTQTPVDERLYEPVGDPALGVRYRRRQAGGRRLGEQESQPQEAEDGRSDGPALMTAGRPEAEEPQDLLVELRGHRRPRLAACWDGCVFKM
jgi:hypothetical protein